MAYRPRGKADRANFRVILERTGIANPTLAVLKAEVAALNRIGAKVRTYATREITQYYNVKYRRILNAIRPRKASINDLTYELSVIGRRLLLADFNPRPGVTGASVEVRRGHREEKPDTFVVKKLPKKVYIRLNVLKGYEYERYPIVPMHGPSLARMFSAEKLRALMTQFVKDKMPKELAHQIEFYMKYVQNSYTYRKEETYFN